MRRAWSFFTALILVIVVSVTMVVRIGLPMHSLRPPEGVLIGTVNEIATDPSRADIFTGAAQRIVPFQILYPARESGTAALYVPDAQALIDAVAERQGWMVGVALERNYYDLCW